LFSERFCLASENTTTSGILAEELAVKPSSLYS
jgi:hypothetical protein